MTAKVLAALAAAEGLIVAGVVGIGAELHTAGTGVLAFGLAWYAPVVIDHIRARR